MWKLQILFLIFYQYNEAFAENRPSLIRVNKCCEPNEILVDLRCTDANETSSGKQFVQ